jgi:hypothetical protein
MVLSTVGRVCLGIWFSPSNTEQGLCVDQSPRDLILTLMLSSHTINRSLPLPLTCGLHRLLRHNRLASRLRIRPPCLAPPIRRRSRRFYRAAAACSSIVRKPVPFSVRAGKINRPPSFQSLPAIIPKSPHALRSPSSRRTPMASQSKFDANRRNAQKSTGPKTPEGKTNSHRDGLQHGLIAPAARSSK